MAATSAMRPGLGLCASASALGALFAGLAAASAAGWAFLPAPAEYLLSVAAFPLGALAGGGLLRWRRGAEAVDLFSRRLGRGCVWGLAATLVYDAYRPLVKLALDMSYDPYRAQPVFGGILTGLPEASAAAQIVGWGYHLWIGCLIGMIFSLVWPRGGVVAGVAFTLGLQVARWLVYPEVFVAGLQDEEFLANAVFGYGLWGVVLGAGVKWRRPYALA